MIIRITIGTQNDPAILEKGMAYINRAALGEPQWKEHCNCNYYETECDIPEKDILPVFNGLIAEYPPLDLYASYTYDIREDDHSAQWWERKTLKTERRPDGSTVLSTGSSIHWF